MSKKIILALSLGMLTFSAFAESDAVKIQKNFVDVEKNLAAIQKIANLHTNSKLSPKEILAVQTSTSKLLKNWGVLRAPTLRAIDDSTEIQLAKKAIMGDENLSTWISRKASALNDAAKKPDGSLADVSSELLGNFETIKLFTN